MFLVLSPKLLGAHHLGIGEFVLIEDNADSRRDIGDEVFPVHAVTVGEGISIEKYVTENGTTVD